MRKIIAEKLWLFAAPILKNDTKKTGRPQKDPKKVFMGVMCVLDNGLKWDWLPEEYGKKSTVHGRYMKWVRTGLINRIFEKARTLYLSVTKAFPNWLAVDTSSCKASLAKHGGKSPVDRGKRGVKKNIAVDSNGAPVAVSVCAGNIHDSKTFRDIIVLAKPAARDPIMVVAADSAYDSKKLREIARQEGFILHAATNRRRKKDCPIIRPRGRWIVEGTHSWLNAFRGVKTCFVKLANSFLGFLQLAASVLLLRLSGVFG